MQFQLLLRDGDGDFVVVGAETRSHGFQVRLEWWDARRLTFTVWGRDSGRTYNIWGKHRPQVITGR